MSDLFAGVRPVRRARFLGLSFDPPPSNLPLPHPPLNSAILNCLWLLFCHQIAGQMIQNISLTAGACLFHFFPSGYQIYAVAVPSFGLRWVGCGRTDYGLRATAPNSPRSPTIHLSTPPMLWRYGALPFIPTSTITAYLRLLPPSGGPTTSPPP